MYIKKEINMWVDTMNNMVEYGKEVNESHQMTADRREL